MTPDDERAGIERMRAHVQGVFDQAATDAARAAGNVPRTGPEPTAYDDLRDGDRVRHVYAYDLEHDTWQLGELLATRRRGQGPDAAWEGYVVWGHEQSHRVDWLPADRIKPGPSLDGSEADG